MHIPPLRERIDDLPLLLEHYLAAAAQTFCKPMPYVSQKQLTELATYGFPGNVRELEALVFDAVARHQSGELVIDLLEQGVSGQEMLSGTTVTAESPLVTIFGTFPTMEQAEEYMIAEALKVSVGNQGVAANMLGISRQTLNKKLGAKIKV